MPRTLRLLKQQMFELDFTFKHPCFPTWVKKEQQVLN